DRAAFGNIRRASRTALRTSSQQGFAPCILRAATPGAASAAHLLTRTFRSLCCRAGRGNEKKLSAWDACCDFRRKSLERRGGAEKPGSLRLCERRRLGN